MRVDCPACDAQYEIPDHLLAAGPRKLRCARCGNEWLPELRAEEAEPPPEPEPAAEEEDEASFLGKLEADEPLAPPPPPPEAHGGRIWAAWAASLLLLGGGAAAAWAWRAPLMEAWPPATHLFAALGGA